MNMRAKAIVGLCALTLAAGVGFVSVAQVDQPHMERALSDLQAAKAELQAAERNKGGHRTAAVNLINQAILQVQAGMAVGDGY
jgi:hypothetical protein